jgi:PhnB protein
MTKGIGGWIGVVALAVAACGGSQRAATPEPGPAAEAPRAEVTRDGFQTVNPHLVVDDVDAAAAWYVKALGAELAYAMPGPGGATMHAEIRLGDSVVMLSPTMEEMGQKSPVGLGGTSVGVNVYVAEVDAVFQRAIEAGATAVMPVADMFWGDRFGELRDPFGHRWSLATRIEEVGPEEIGRRAQAWMGAMAKGEAPPAFERTSPAASWKPDGWRSVTASLTVARPDEAIAFYVTALGAEEVTRIAAPDGRIMHAELKVGDSRLMLSGEHPEMPGPRSPAALGGTPVKLMVYVADVDADFARAVEAGARPMLPPADMFWGDRFGVVVDPEGHVWGLATAKEDLTPEQIQERMRQQLGGGEPAAD